jgi:hypothetical protein
MKTTITEEIKIPAVKFLDREGKEASIDVVLAKEDYWVSRNKKSVNWIVSHRGVEKIAKVAGIKPQINTRFEIQVEPNYANAMAHEVVANMTCEAYEIIDTPSGKKLGVLDTSLKCLHGSDKVFFSTGEAGRGNTGARGGSYMRIMAEKRAYDRGVLQHLGINGDVNVYSEEEAEAFDKDPGKPLDQIIEKLSPILNKILNAESKDQLKTIAEEIRKEKLDEQELEYLRGVWKRKNNEFIESF